MWQTLFSFLPLLEKFYQPKAIIGWHFVSTFICKWGLEQTWKTQPYMWAEKKLGKKISTGNRWEVFNIFSVQTSIIFVKKLSKCKCIVRKDGYGVHAARVPPDWHVICRASSMNDKTVLSKSFCSYQYCIISKFYLYELNNQNFV